MDKITGKHDQHYRLTLVIFIFFHAGLILELLLIGHYESFWQYFPLISLGLGLMGLLFLHKSLQVVKFFYLLTMLAGVLGVILHLKSNWEFELEMYPGIPTTELILESLTGALPALAPATLIPIGLIGFLLIQLKSNKHQQ